MSPNLPSVRGVSAGCRRCNMCCNLVVQARPDVQPAMTEMVVATMSKVSQKAGIAGEITALVNYIEDRILTRNVMKLRKQWDDDRHAKVTAAIATAMTQWDEEHYPKLLQATWGWHPFYPSFVANPLCTTARPKYPLYHSVVEGLGLHSQLLQRCHVGRVYPVPWSALLLRCFLMHDSLLPPLVSHPVSGGSVSNVTAWMKLAAEGEGEGSLAWQLARRYLKQEGFLIFAGARPIDCQQEWYAEVEAAWVDFKSPTPDWWAELHVWCQTIQYRAVEDMAFHDKASWLAAWVLRDQPATTLPPLACYDKWLQHREDLDIGYVLGNPGNFHHLFLQPEAPSSTFIPNDSLVTCPCVHAVADVMVPSLERTEYMYELHNISENIVNERGKHSEVQPRTHADGADCYKEADGWQDEGPPVGSQPAPASPSNVHVAPVFHIPMTQEKTLQELPSQLDFEWTESATPDPSTAPAAAQNLQVDVLAFEEVSQIAHEAVIDATSHPPGTSTTVTTVGDTV